MHRGQQLVESRAWLCVCGGGSVFLSVEGGGVDITTSKFTGTK